MKTAAKRTDMTVTDEMPFPMADALMPRTPAEICRFVTLKEHYKLNTIFDVQVDDRRLTVLYTDRAANNLSRFDVAEGVHHFDTQLEARRHARDLRKLEYNMSA